MIRGAPLDRVRMDGPDRAATADRFCAWKGRSDHRRIFTVVPRSQGHGLDDLPLERGAVVLGVQREDDGSRRVLWVCAVGAGRVPAELLPAIAAIGTRGGEVHLHLLAIGDAAREAIAADLGYPRLAPIRREALPQIAAMMFGTSMNPPDWRCQRSA